MGGGLGPLIQTHPGEFAFVSPNAPSLPGGGNWEASARADFAHGPTASGAAGSVGVTYNISVPLTGGATPQQGEMVASAIARAIKRRDPELMGQLDRWAGNTRRL
jgi:hypothetical protein